MRGVFLHVMADTLGSVGVILSTILINIYGWTGFDPIASMFIAILIAASVVPLVIDTGKVLALDLGGKEGDVERALQEISGIAGVQSYTEARFWPLEQSRLVGSIHIQVAPGFIGVESHGHSHGHFHGPSKLDRIRENVEHVLKSKIKGLDELVVQIDG
ncbi:putative zinc transporter msc2 [Serendipita sp. 411]|nr:putative zinc transporter msc2 [Serendipita sp. 411]